MQRQDTGSKARLARAWWLSSSTMSRIIDSERVIGVESSSRAAAAPGHCRVPGASSRRGTRRSHWVCKGASADASGTAASRRTRQTRGACSIKNPHPYPTVELLPRHVRHTASYIWHWPWPCPGSLWMIERSAVQSLPSPDHGASELFFVDLPDGASATNHLSARLTRADQLARALGVGERLPRPTRSLDPRTSAAGRFLSAFSSSPRTRTR